MLPLVFMMLLILGVAAVVVSYVAWPHRGQEMPGMPWMGKALRRGADSLPVLSESERRN